VPFVEPVAIPWAKPREERADAARNRAHLIEVARRMVAEVGIENVTMDALAEQAGLGKGTVFRRFGSRAGIFLALLDEEEVEFQRRVLSGPPPLGPGASPVDRLVAFGRARMEFLLERTALARAALDPAQPAPIGRSPSLFHVQTLLRAACPDTSANGALALQLTAALEGPILLYIHAPGRAGSGSMPDHLADSWKTLVERVCPPDR
jgi:polyketide synthase 12